MVIYEQKKQALSFKAWIKTFIIKNHYKTIYRPVRSGCSSVRVPLGDLKYVLLVDIYHSLQSNIFPSLYFFRNKFAVGEDSHIEIFEYNTTAINLAQNVGNFTILLKTIYILLKL